ncbi:hypothetical protein EVAR_35768_1 [Eumeta japonica]|uniref:Uncharacterized protein n=1 Tax=Eumeta variegata TaxID=151549 RepID=A0A4C1WQH0_EUMVA|nr:hypothetical protein EVAR_35768_1 [Eumeta japonica]
MNSYLPVYFAARFQNKRADRRPRPADADQRAGAGLGNRELNVARGREAAPAAAPFWSDYRRLSGLIRQLLLMKGRERLLKSKTTTLLAPVKYLPTSGRGWGQLAQMGSHGFDGTSALPAVIAEAPALYRARPAAADATEISFTTK